MGKVWVVHYLDNCSTQHIKDYYFDIIGVYNNQELAKKIRDTYEEIYDQVRIAELEAQNG